MKTIFLITLLSFFPCQKAAKNTAPQPVGQLSVSTPSVNFTADGGSQDITVICKNSSISKMASKGPAC
jgi:hypothetical protein